MLNPSSCTARADGRTTLHALGSLEARGSLFAGVATEVYAGMIVGECARGSDLEVNPVREKKLTNVRAANNDDKARARLDVLGFRSRVRPGGQPRAREEADQRARGQQRRQGARPCRCPYVWLSSGIRARG